MVREYSNGWHWFDWKGQKLRVDERWHSRFISSSEQKIALQLKRSLAWIFDDWFGFENKVLVKAFTVESWRAKKHYGLEDGFVMLQAAYVHPESRSNGHFKRFLEHAMKIADENDGYITAICRPFCHSSEERGIQPPSLKQIAKDFTKCPTGLRYEPVTDEKGKQQQQQMASMLASFGWTSIDLRATMQFPELFGDYGFVY